MCMKKWVCQLRLSCYLQLLTELHMGIHHLFLLSISSISIIWRHKRTVQSGLFTIITEKATLGTTCKLTLQEKYFLFFPQEYRGNYTQGIRNISIIVQHNTYARRAVLFMDTSPVTLSLRSLSMSWNNENKTASEEERLGCLTRVNSIQRHSIPDYSMYL